MSDLIKPTITETPLGEQLETFPKTYIEVITLAYGQSPAVVDGKCQAGHWYFMEQDCTDTIRIIVVEKRWHCFILNNETIEKESYIRNSEISQFIKLELQARKDSYPDYQLRLGWSFLLYLPDHREFAIYHTNKFASQGVMRELITCITPLDKRDTEAQRKKPHTTVFALSTGTKTSRQTGKPYVIPIAKPLEETVLNPEDIPDKKKLEQALLMFLAPVKTEQNEVKAEDDER